MISLMEFKMIMIMIFCFFCFFCPVPLLEEGSGTGGKPSRPHLMALETKEKREKKKKTPQKIQSCKIDIACRVRTVGECTSFSRVVTIEQPIVVRQAPASHSSSRHIARLGHCDKLIV